MICLAKPTSELERYEYDYRDFSPDIDLQNNHARHFYPTVGNG